LKELATVAVPYITLENVPLKLTLSLIMDMEDTMVVMDMVVTDMPVDMDMVIISERDLLNHTTDTHTLMVFITLTLFLLAPLQQLLDLLVLLDTPELPLPSLPEAHKVLAVRDLPSHTSDMLGSMVTHTVIMAVASPDTPEQLPPTLPEAHKALASKCPNAKSVV
jgi:hypothetical protein